MSDVAFDTLMLVLVLFGGSVGVIVGFLVGFELYNRRGVRKRNRKDG
jgi:gas vesicle protein